MRHKKILMTNFSHSHYSESFCLRAENEQELTEYLCTNKQEKLLARGAGLSYNDSCFHTNGTIIDTQRFNHLMQFDSQTGIVTCQGNVTFYDLFLLHPDYIPAVIPGTLHATVAGGIAHDVHGKNNHHAGSFGHHVLWMDLLVNGKSIHCSREENNDLFYATIGGAGLTGVITHTAIQLKKASRSVAVEHQQINSLNSLLKIMSTTYLKHDYQVAWLDLLQATMPAILSCANHGDYKIKDKPQETHTSPKFPFKLLWRWNMQLFNKLYFCSKKENELLSLTEFNNPLDKLQHWNRIYGPHGLLQFQAVFPQEQAEETIKQLVHIINNNNAVPMLSVLKLLTRQGEGLLSFCQPGFTLAIDFANNIHSKNAILAMNQLITELNGRVYLAKDQFLNKEQFHKSYVKIQQFNKTRTQYKSPMESDLSKRLGITL